MTNEEHERERRAFWDACYVAYLGHDTALPEETIVEWANRDLAERDERWPAPKESSGEPTDNGWRPCTKAEALANPEQSEWDCEPFDDSEWWPMTGDTAPDLEGHPEAYRFRTRVTGKAGV